MALFFFYFFFNGGIMMYEEEEEEGGGEAARITLSVLIRVFSTSPLVMVLHPP